MSDKKTMPCPACREDGGDKKGNHLTRFDSGKFSCALHPGDKEHNRRIIKAMPELGADKATLPQRLHFAVKVRKEDITASTPFDVAYAYHDANGKHVYDVRRYSKPEKDFRPYNLATGTLSLKGVPRVLYRLAEVSKAETVWITEGEKDADNLAAVGRVATCRAGGSSVWEPELTGSLAGKDIILCGDNDVPGKNYMEIVEAALTGNVKSIRRVMVPAPHKDISDYLGQKSEHEAGSALEELLTVPDPFRCVDWLDFSAEQAREPEPVELIEGVLHRGSKLVLGGSSKSNKTWSLLDMAISVASGRAWWGKTTTQGAVVYCDMELSKKQLFKRVSKLLEARGITLARGQLHLVSLRGHVANAAKTVERIRKAAPSNVALIVIDPIYKFNAGRDENSAGDIGEMLNTLESLAVETGAAVAYAAHYSKGNQAAKESIDRISGSGVYARDADSLVMMTKHVEDACFSVETTVRNFAPVEPFVMRWNYPLMERADNLDPADLKKSGGRPESGTKEELFDLVSKPLSYSDWLNAAETNGFSKATFNRKRKELVACGLVTQTPGTRLWVRKEGN